LIISKICNWLWRGYRTY